MSVAAASTTPVVPRRRSAILDFCTQQPLGATSFVIIFVMMFAGIFAEYVAPYNPLDIDFGGILSPPSWEHPGGTDAFGRDIFSRIIYGSRTALVIMPAPQVNCVPGSIRMKLPVDRLSP